MTRELQDLIKQVAIGLVDSSYAIALTGAGISTESGIPDFRGPEGVWTKNPDAEKASYGGYERFLTDPKGWWQMWLNRPFGFLDSFYKAEPNPGHFALSELEKMGILKCVLTQNGDNLHQKAGSKNVLEYHGSLFKLRCVKCGSRYPREAFDVEKLQKEDKLPPICTSCSGALKLDGVGFGEPIPTDVATLSYDEALKCDYMLICGTSATVYPFAELPRVARAKNRAELLGAVVDGTTSARSRRATIVEVNGEPTRLTFERISDYFIQGMTGEVLPRIVEEVARLKKG